MMGLQRYAESKVATLSTGTRRIVELACLVAVRPAVILLDEPMAGIAQRESEAFGPPMLDLRRQLDAALLIIEHDIPLVSSLNDRPSCLENGVVSAEGPQDEVRGATRAVGDNLGTGARARH